MKIKEKDLKEYKMTHYYTKNSKKLLKLLELSSTLTKTYALFTEDGLNLTIENHRKKVGGRWKKKSITYNLDTPWDISSWESFTS